MDRKRPIVETDINRNKFLLCKLSEKLHKVFIKYEMRVATVNAIPFANAGVININSMQIVAIMIWINVTNKPDRA